MKPIGFSPVAPRRIGYRQRGHGQMRPIRLPLWLLGCLPASEGEQPFTAKNPTREGKGLCADMLTSYAPCADTQ